MKYFKGGLLGIFFASLAIAVAVGWVAVLELLRIFFFGLTGSVFWSVALSVFTAIGGVSGVIGAFCFKEKE